MKHELKLINFLIFFIVVSLSSFTIQAQTPHDSLNQYISDLQKNPNDNTLREKIIKHVHTMKPKPAIPDDARRFFVKAVTFAKEAKSPSDYELAVKTYQDALLIAPWWPEAYYNLSIALAGAERFDEASVPLNLYLLTKPTPLESQEAKDRLYSLEAKKELAQKQQAERKEADRKKEAEFIRNLAGEWELDRDPTLSIHHLVYRVEVSNSNDITIKYVQYYIDGHPEHSGTLVTEETYRGTISDRRISGTWSRTQDLRSWKCIVFTEHGSFDGSISDDGKTIQLNTLNSNVFDLHKCRWTGDSQSSSLTLIRFKR
jgi:tetratricopeptide (TPR) repeat protein